jgi:hypothetical protein
MGLGGIGRSYRLQLVAGLGSAADPRPHQPGKAGGGRVRALLGLATRDIRIFDWLDRQLAA